MSPLYILQSTSYYHDFSGLICICIFRFWAHLLTCFVVNSSSYALCNFVGCGETSSLLREFCSFFDVLWACVNALFLVWYTLRAFCVPARISSAGVCGFGQNMLDSITRLKSCIPSRHAFSDLLFARVDIISNGILREYDFWILNQCENKWLPQCAIIKTVIIKTLFTLSRHIQFL